MFKRFGKKLVPTQNTLTPDNASNYVDTKIEEYRNYRFSLENIHQFDGDLIVDDTESNRIVLKKFLKFMKVDAEEAVDGLDALDKLKDKNYRIIWMDIKMPTLNGLEASKYIRQKYKYTGPICVVTAFIDNHIQNQCAEINIDDIINKPIDFALIKDMSYKLLSDKPFITPS